MVSPVDKEGGDIVVVSTDVGYPAGLNQAAPAGDKITYSSYRAFGDAQGAPYTTPVHGRPRGE